MRSLVVLLLFASSFGYSQQQFIANNENKVSSQSPKANELLYFCILEIEAKADQNEWQTYLLKHLELDSLAMDSIPPGRYKLMAQFEIGISGKIANVRILNDPGFGLGYRVASVISASKGLWKPATINGLPVKSYRTQPITFVIEEQEECEKMPIGLTL
ncbi:MAG TPA: hypothetical protein PKI55_01275 [Chitinophagaceae bacterium]|nr:hypothetical protein [Chitinophagaceae bacterium]